MAGARSAPTGAPQLTAREAEVLRYLRLRLTNREIAERLVVSTRTVESHVSSLLAKLGKAGRRELADADAALDSAASGPGHLPELLDSFVGRVQEQEEISQLLSVHRLLTLVGPPGVGKTRLAVEVARRVAPSFAANVRVVELAPAGTDADVADRVLLALGGRQVPGQSALATLASEARDDPLLVLLDNCEHVITAAGTAARQLLEQWSHVVVLATSREPLHVPGEIVRPILPLSVPAPAESDPVNVLDTEAVRLLVDRAWASGAGLSITAANAAAVALLCRRLDGLPLAVELVAGRLRAFTADQLTDRLDTSLSWLTGAGSGRAAQTLRGAIERSYDSLTVAQRSLFTALSVFPATFAVDAAERICADPAQPPDLVGEFAALIDRSLISVVPSGTANRYRLLETLRDYAREKLSADAWEQLSARHAAYYIELAEDAEPRLHGPSGREWLQRLRAEHDDLAQALEWALVHEPVGALRLVGALWQFWQDTDQRRSGIEWAERSLASNAAAPASVRLKALLAAALLVAPWDVSRCGELVADATEIARELDDPEWTARTQLAAAYAAAYATEPTPEQLAAGQRSAHAAIEFFRANGDQWRAAEALNTLSLLGPDHDALDTVAEARRLYELEGDELRAANCAYMAAAMLVRTFDDARRGRPLAEDALAMALRVGSEHEAAHARSILAEIDLRDGAVQSASEVAAECLKEFRRVADHRCVTAMLLLLGTAAAQRGADETASEYLHEALEAARLGAHAATLPLIQAQLVNLDVRGSD